MKVDGLPAKTMVSCAFELDRSRYLERELGCRSVHRLIDKRRSRGAARAQGRDSPRLSGCLRGKRKARSELSSGAGPESTPVVPTASSSSLHSGSRGVDRASW